MSLTRKQIMAAMMSGSGGGEVTPSLPYDAEIEYIQTSGTQYIDTGIIQNTRNFELTLVIQWTGSTASQFETFFGYSWRKIDNLYPRFQVFKYNGNWTYGTNSTNTTSIAVNANSHTFFVTGNASTNQETLYIDGVSIMTSTTTSTGLSADSPSHWLGGQHSLSNGVDSLNRPASAKFYSLNYKKFSDASHTTLIQEWNFIPVRVGQVGYMYETIGGTLHGNSGSGTFALGNDINLTEMNLSSMTGIQAVISSASNQWMTTLENYSCWLIPVIAGTLYKIKANQNYDTPYAFLKSDAHANNTSPSFATGYTGRLLATAGTEIITVAPSDATYLYVLIHNSTNDLSPQRIYKQT